MLNFSLTSGDQVEFYGAEMSDSLNIDQLNPHEYN